MFEKINFAHHSVTTVGRCPSAPADDYFDAFLVDCRIAFWVKQKTKYFVNY